MVMLPSRLIQGRFVDAPREAVAAADWLVAERMQTLARGFAGRRHALEDLWQRCGSAARAWEPRICGSCSSSTSRSSIGCSEPEPPSATSGSGEATVAAVGHWLERQTSLRHLWEVVRGSRVFAVRMTPSSAAGLDKREGDVLSPLRSPRQRRDFARRVLTAVALGGIASLALVGLTGGPAYAAGVLVVNQAHPACTDDGSGTPLVPFCTISAGAARAVAGDTVLVHAGTYQERVKPERSGLPDQPIIFTAAPGETVVVTGGTFGFMISSRDWITVKDFVVRDTSWDGIYVSDATNIVITGNEVYGAGQPVKDLTGRGIYLAGTQNSTVADNVAHHNTEAGVFLKATSSNNTIRGNIVYANAREYVRAACGIDVRGTDNLITGNVAYNNEDSGLQFYTGAARNRAISNVTFGNGDHGIDNLNSPDQVIVGNTVYQNFTAGINVEGSSPGATVMNNVSVDNALVSTRTKGNIRVDAQSTSGATVDWNLTWLSSTGWDYIFGAGWYRTPQAFYAATGQSAHGVYGNPLFQSASGGDFRLSAGSPAIDSANAGAPGHQSTDADGQGRVDDPATANTGVGVRPYDDRGAYEFQP